jgi:Ser/Thr protein kinase RdoA (MazF antagonist)
MPHFSITQQLQNGSVIIHRDLTARNVLVFSLDKFLVKVTDLGLSLRD